MKFVIRSNLEDLGGDLNAASADTDSQESTKVTADQPGTTPTVIPLDSAENEKKRKRAERDAVPMATKKVPLFTLVAGFSKVSTNLIVRIRYTPT